ncbi:MAG: hypothetical protein SH850_06785 [Planctomycetaceae bacterium]|nr:hypothetical protein [Planctomycetaceae bacterium]
MTRTVGLSLMLCTVVASVGCRTPFGLGGKKCDSGCGQTGCDSCGIDGYGAEGCDDGCGGKFSLKKSWGKCKDCSQSKLLTGGCCSSCCSHRSLAIPEIYPVGAVQRAHFHQMQTNAEAMDFVLFQKDFVLDSAELTPDGKDKIVEIAARMRSAPFPVIVERMWNNADPELDAHRRALVAQILADFGNADANNRTFVSNAYGPGKSSLEGAPEYYQNIYIGNQNNLNGAGSGGGGNGGVAGGGGGGGGGGVGSGGGAVGC